MTTNNKLQRVYNAAYDAFQAGEYKGHILWLAIAAYANHIPPVTIGEIVNKAELAAINNFYKYLA